ncbi:hypothetical protein C1H46_033163 [Malus baccata]|uniref:glucan endo-1,3-beta-D-glucosidase n=1 Tax=Malus baccata TaxID=106549 RepID=A0A540L476_MALBA|nr:hypothetical protein C1H46_033163 [Malus baccata]
MREREGEREKDDWSPTLLGEDAVNLWASKHERVADNLPPPSNTAKLFQSISIKRVRLYSADPTIIKAFTGSGIAIVIKAKSIESFRKVDAVRSALNAFGFKDIDILIAETGWPYHGDDNEIGPSVENARAYNGNLIAHLRSMVGTPLMPGKSVEMYIFALYDEDLKPGPASERSFGLFKPDLTVTYDVGLTKSSQANLDYACSHGIDCSAIQPRGACFDPNTVASHAAYAMNLYYHIVVTVPLNCDFSQTATLTSSNPNKFSLTRAHIEMAQVYHDEDALYTKGYPGGSTGLPVEAGKVNIISNNGFVKAFNCKGS